MTITEIPSEDLEGQLLRHIDTYHAMHELPEADTRFMREAVNELRLRRLARSVS